MSIARLMQMGAAGGGGINVADVFSTYLYVGNASGQGANAQSITNNIDLSGEGGLVWLKNRDSGGTSAWSHYLFDTERGATKYIQTDENTAELTSNNSLSAFNSDGFTLGETGGMNNNGDSYASWTFRKAPRFFDVVTYTGDGTTGRQISHNLDATVGMMILKQTSGSGYWGVYHRSVDSTSPEDYVLILQSTSARIDEQFFINDTAPTSTHFTVGAAAPSGGDFNTNGDTYVAYLFAHDTGANGVVQCGSYTGNGSATGPTTTLGWEPQWLMIKRSDNTGDWWIYDSARDATNPRTAKLLANSNAAEDTSGEDLDFTATGFQPKTTATGINASGGSYIYIAIRAET